MITDQMRRIFVGVTEGALAIGMVFICFLLITDIIEAIFPSSLSSELTVSVPIEASVLEHPHWRQLALTKGDRESYLEDYQKMAATVVKTENSVKCKRATSVSWEKSRQGMLLYQQDALQTLSNASAVIEFGAHNQARLGEKTLIIIKQMEKDMLFNDKRTFILLVEGALRTQLSPSEINAAYLNLETPQATLRMHSMDGITDARVVAGPDKTSTLSVYQGAVEVATQTERRTVHANQAIRIPSGKPLAELLNLPRPVEQLSPVDMSQHFIKKRAAKISFSWQERTESTGYHFMLARDSNFKDIVVDKIIRNNRCDWRNLLPGTYYWRVSMLADDIEGYYSKIHRLHIHRQTAPPRLLANYPPDKVYYRTVAPTVGFAWRNSPGSPTYYWQMARDEDFMDMVSNKTLRSNRINSSKLTEGIYYWRVGLKGSDNHPISFSDTRCLEIIQDSEPPSLSVEFPPMALYDQDYTITGYTEPGVKVFIGGYEAKVKPSGDFTYTMRLDKGKNVIAVAATDEANNVTSKSQIVICE